MNLNITNAHEYLEVPGTIVLRPSNLLLAGTIMFIASNKFEKTVIELPEEGNVNIEYLKIIASRSDEVSIVKMTDRTVIDANYYEMLSALLPAKAGEIRRCQMMSGDIKEVVSFV